MQSVTKSISRYLSLPFLNGVIIIEVSKSSPADRAGLKPGDIIIKANGATIYKPSDIRNLILERDLRSGDTIKLKIYRDQKYKSKIIKLGKYYSP